MSLTYAAAFLDAEGQLIRNKHTAEIMNVQIGEFENQQDAIDQACLDLECHHKLNGILLKDDNKGGFMLVTTQELGEL